MCYVLYIQLNVYNIAVKMMDTTSNDDRISTGSSISGVYKNISQSPAPICMFYFSHPFGISTPQVRTQHLSTTSNESTPPRNVNLMRQIFREKCSRDKYINTPTHYEDNRLDSFIPWPKNTWSRDYILPPLVELIAKRKGQKIPDLEVILNSIQQAWNTPHNRSLLNSGVVNEEDSSSSSNWDLTNVGRQKQTVSKQLSVTIMGSGAHGSVDGVGPGLMRRRYSVPEIIMRKHSLSQQKSHDEERINTNTTIRTPEITSGSDSNLSRGITGGGSSSGISCNTIGLGTNLSSSNRNYYYGSNGSGISGSGGNEIISMRKSTLLRRIWSKELQRNNYLRSGTWSPPLRRAQYQRKVIHTFNSFDDTQLSGQCLECKKLNDEYFDNSPKRLRLTTTNTTTSSSSVTSIIENPEARENKSLPSPNLNESIKNYTQDTDENVKIYMKSVSGDSNDGKLEELQSHDILCVEIDTIDPHENNENTLNFQQSKDAGTITILPRNPLNDAYVSNLLIDNLNNILNNCENSLSDNNNNNSNDDNQEEYDKNENLIMNSNIESITNNNNNKIKTCDNNNVNLNLTNIYIKSELISDFELRKQNSKENANFVFEKDYKDSKGVIDDKLEEIEDNKSLEYCNEDSNRIVFDFKTTEETIYFPRYSSESHGDLSSHTSQASDPEPQEIISVSTGSVYPFNGIQLVIIPRLSAIPRTESMEVQGSCNEDNSENESSISLVDSLDDPQSPTGLTPKSQKIKKNEESENVELLTSGSPANSLRKETFVESSLDDSSRSKSESFFVPITDEYDIMDETLVVAESMPDRLRERLQRRQMELDLKHKHNDTQEYKNKLKNKNSIIVLDNLSKNLTFTTDPQTTSDINLNQQKLNKNTKIMMRQELGLLESYTIDSKGQMQFNNDGGNKLKSESAVKVLPSNGNIINHAKKSLGATKKLKSNGNSHFSTVKNGEKFNRVKTIGSTSNRNKNIQKLTLYGNEIITPDKEGGPRRMYQKTEIQNNGKSIEILEIVECNDENENRKPLKSITNNNRNKPNNNNANKNNNIGDAINNKVKSKIPLPTSGRAARSLSTSSHETKSQNNKNNNGNKFDRMIANMLIEAINNPDDATIELVNSPKNVSCGNKTASKKNNNNNTLSSSSIAPVNRRFAQKFEVIPEERSSVSLETSSNDEIKKTLKKNQKIFQTMNRDERFIVLGSVIERSCNTTNTTTTTSTTTRPTEMISNKTKCNHPSFDIINKENETKNFNQIESQSGMILSQSSIGSSTDAQYQYSIAPNTFPTKQSNGYNGGHINEDEVETKEWAGYFKRYDGSDIESMTEDCIQTPNSNITVTTNETLLKPNKNINKISINKLNDNEYNSIKKISSPPSSIGTSITSESQIINTSNSVLYPSGTESENILSVIERTFQNQAKEKNVSKEDEATDQQSIDSTYLKECLNKENCSQCKLDKNQNNHHQHNETNKNDNHNTKECNCIEKGYPGKVNNDISVWQVCGLTDCKLIKIKLDSSVNKIDSSSFTLYPDDNEPSPINNVKNSSIPIQSPTNTKKKNHTIYDDLSNERKSGNADNEKKKKKEKSGHFKSKINDNANINDNLRECCFCNPEFHYDTNKICNFCKTNKFKYDENSKSNNLHYEILSKSDHIHKQTKVRDSDVTSVKCVKTNNKITRSFLPQSSSSQPTANDSAKPTPSSAGNANYAKAYLFSPKSNMSSSSNEKFIMISPRVNRHSNQTNGLNSNSSKKSMNKAQKIIYDEVVSKADQTTNDFKSKLKNLRLPSPYTTTELSSNQDDDYDESSSNDEETVLKLKNKNLNSNYIVEKAANQWRNNAHQKAINSRRWIGRNYEELTYNNSNISNIHSPSTVANQNALPRQKGKWGPKPMNNDAPGNNNNQGWSVTVAGNYNPEMAPDVQMRLSFPNQNNTTLNYQNQLIYQNNNNHDYRIDNFNNFDDLDDRHNTSSQYSRANTNVYGKYHKEDLQMISNGNETQRINRNYVDPRNPQALPPATLNSYGILNENPKRTLMKTNDRRNVSGYCNLPDVNHKNYQSVAKQNTRKAIKKVECSVAVTASTTRTISNISNSSKRSLSYQSINIPETTRQITRKRDRSVDIGTASSRRMSFDSRPFSEESMKLSILGNAIAPEHKPKVPTMSEKDLTRRHISCFTRNHPFLT